MQLNKVVVLELLKGFSTSNDWILLIVIGEGDVGLGDDLNFADDVWMTGGVDEREPALSELVLQCIFFLAYF